MGMRYVDSDVSKLLTADEIAFLKQHDIPFSDVADARHLTGRQRHAAMDHAGHRYYVGSKCEKAGHRLRSKRGACIQCAPHNIGFYRRTYEAGTVYIMGSLKTGLLKVGTSKNIEMRQNKNNWESHGGADDWVILFEQKFENAGTVELDAHARLERFGAAGKYLKDRKIVQQSRELFKCAFSVARSAIVATKEKQLSKEWVSPVAGQFDFGTIKNSSS